MIDVIMQEVNLMLLQLLAGLAQGWERSCGVKVAHFTEARAQWHADRLNASGKRRKRSPYPCVWCFHWHVGATLRGDNLRYLANEVMRIQREETVEDTKTQQAGQ